MAGFLLAYHSAGSEEEMTLPDTWNTTKVVVAAASGVVVAIANPQVPGDIILIFIMMDFSLAIQGFWVNHFTQCLHYLLVWTPVMVPQPAQLLLLHNFHLYCIF